MRHPADPESHPRLSLGSVQYSLGNLTAAIQSYRRALICNRRSRRSLSPCVVLKLTNRLRSAHLLRERRSAGSQALYSGNAYRNGQASKNLLWRSAGGRTRRVRPAACAIPYSFAQRYARPVDRRRKTRPRPSDSIARTWTTTRSENRQTNHWVCPSKTPKPQRSVTALFAEALHSVNCADELARLY